MLINQATDIFPQDPYTAHDAKGGRSHTEIAQEKHAYRELLKQSAQMFSGVSKELTLAAIPLMQEFHFNQFRGGPGAPHYTQHTMTVARMAAEAIRLADSPYQVHSASGEVIDPQAIAFVVGALHDSREDFYINFTGTAREMSAEDGAKIVEARILEKLTPIIGQQATEEIISLVRILSLTNDAEFPTREYVNGIVENCYTKAVKQSDYSHNIMSFPDFSPAYPLIIVPAQYQPVVAGTCFERDFAESLILNLAKFNPDEVVPWNKSLAERGVKTVEHLLELCELFNEPQALDRVRAYFLKLHREVSEGAYDSFLKLSGLTRDVVEKISPLLNALESPLPGYLQGAPGQESSPPLPEVSESFVGEVPLRVLGPMKGWGFNIVFAPKFLDQVEKAVVQTSSETQQRIPGYFYQLDEDSMVFHISRYPRRVGQEVPPIETYQETVKTLTQNILKANVLAYSSEEPLAKEPTIRVVLGMEEGYFEGRRKEVLSMVEKGAVSTQQELHEALVQKIGDYGAVGIDLSQTNTFEEAVAYVKSLTLSVTHSIEETQTFLGDQFQVSQARIFSAASEYSTPYQEAAAMILAPATRDNFERLVKLADTFKQARFSIEKLDKELVVNLEVLAFSQAKSAS